MRLEVDVVSVPWRAPLVAAHDPSQLGVGTETGAEAATSPARPLVLVRLADVDGHVGHGEAAPLASYDGVGVEDVRGALVPLGDVLAGFARADPLDPATIVACRSVTRLPQALAAVDLALWDLAARRRGWPLWRVLGAPAPRRLEINAVIGAVAPAAAAAEAASALAAGYRTLKIKVASGDDVGRVAAVRAAVGADVAMRLDANGGWGDAVTALRALERLGSFGIELCEEPVHGAEAIAAVAAASGVPIAVDESVGPEVLERRRADAVCLKVAAQGGITGLLDSARRARRVGYGAYLASTLDGPLGIAAALHAGAVIGPDRACGLSTLERFDRPLPAGLRIEHGRLGPPSGPGLGDGLIEWYADRSG